MSLAESILCEAEKNWELFEFVRFIRAAYAKELEAESQAQPPADGLRERFEKYLFDSGLGTGNTLVEVIPVAVDFMAREQAAPTEPKWICDGCEREYDEYVNGCPSCSEQGLHFSVRQAAAPPAGEGSKK